MTLEAVLVVVGYSALVGLVLAAAFGANKINETWDRGTERDIDALRNEKPETGERKSE
jgi:predicted outer membrane lipoprotein